MITSALGNHAARGPGQVQNRLSPCSALQADSQSVDATTVARRWRWGVNQQVTFP